VLTLVDPADSASSVIRQPMVALRARAMAVVMTPETITATSAMTIWMTVCLMPPP
jgi:hypothetical protein